MIKIFCHKTPPENFSISKDALPTGHLTKCNYQKATFE